jgi:glycogen synthase
MTDTSKEAVLKEATEACKNMARWIANTRIKVVRPLWEEHMQKAQRAIDMINAERDQALARERALLDSNKHQRDHLKELNAVRAERDTLANQVEDCARTCAEQAEQILNLQNACKAVLPLMQAADREEVTDVQDWHAAEALIHAALEANQ